MPSAGMSADAVRKSACATMVCERKKGGLSVCADDDSSVRIGPGGIRREEFRAVIAVSSPPWNAHET